MKERMCGANVRRDSWIKAFPAAAPCSTRPTWSVFSVTHMFFKCAVLNSSAFICGTTHFNEISLFFKCAGVNKCTKFHSNQDSTMERGVSLRLHRENMFPRIETFH